MNTKRTLAAALALAALLATHAGVADEIVVTESRDNTGELAARTTAEQLQKEHVAAAEKAVATVLAETKLDLDIRLIGPTSVKIASKL